MTKDEADAQLTKAIHDHAEAHGMYEPGTELIVEAMVITAWQKVPTNGKTTYGTQFPMDPNNSAPVHHIVGMCNTIKHLSLHQGDEFDEDDDQEMP